MATVAHQNTIDSRLAVGTDGTMKWEIKFFYDEGDSVVMMGWKS